MRHLASILVVTLACLQTVKAQDARVKGMVKDTINQTVPQHTVVLLLHPGDSTMVAYTRADAGGRFVLPPVPPGPYLLWISHPAFAPYRDSIRAGPGTTDLGDIFLTLRSQILKEVIIKGVNPIRLKGDTVEYAADSFAVRPNATVEDLLKRLPGIQVDRNGKITAQGRSVQTVLVDGEEFFSDDPTVATKNLPANAVEKVQVFDKKSDQATFTGIDDGQTSRTINLKLKDDKKNGYFGKASAGGGTGGFYENSAAINLFEKKRKLAFFGIAANTGKSGLTMTDKNNYSSTGLTLFDGDETNSFFSPTSDDFTNWSGTYNGQGVPIAWNAGAHYSNKWTDDKYDLNGDYIFNRIKVGVTDNTLSRLILPDSTVNNTNDVNRTTNIDQQHSVSARYDEKPDSMTEVKFTVNSKVRHKDTFGADTSFTTDGDSVLLNRSTNNTNISGQNNTLNSTLSIQHRFHKKGRTFSLGVQENYADIHSTEYQYSLVSTYTNGAPGAVDTTDQHKTNESRNLTLISKLTYSEPLGGNYFLVADYGVNWLSGASDLNAYNRDAGGKFSVLDSTYSNYYNVNILTNLAGAFLKKVGPKYTFSAGSDLGYTSWHQDNIYRDTVQNRNFLNFYPKAAFTYKFSPYRRLYLNYSGNTTQPSIDQLQPVASNNNPLNIMEGNPNLKPSYSSTLTGSYFFYSPLTQRNFSAGGNYTYVVDPFSSRDSVDATGKQYTQTVNVRSSRNLSLNGGYYFKWKKPDVQVGFSGNVSSSEYTNFVNELQNETRSGVYSLGFNMEKYSNKTFNARLSVNAAYNQSRSSLQAASNADYWSSAISAYIGKDLPAKFYIDLGSDINLRQKTAVFNTNTNTAIVNASLTKTFLKDNDLALKLSANDLFNQNTGFSRNISTNNITQSTYTAIHRYFLFTVTWNFSKNGKPSQNFF